MNFLFLLFFTFHVVFAPPGVLSLVIKNPLTPKAYLVRYWSQSIKSNAPQSEFLLSKASPMTAVDSATFTKLAQQNTLSTHLPQFCSAAKLLCFPDLSPSLEKNYNGPRFKYKIYNGQKNWGTGRLGPDKLYIYRDDSEAYRYPSRHVASVKKWVEPGTFFRESMLEQGNVMPMPDIRDKMPPRPFLPRSILSKLPFSTSRLDELKKIFHARDNSTMEKMIVDSLRECERAPSVGEAKRCMGSAEDMIDFATSILGSNVVVRTTDNTNGHNKYIMIGSVKGINGGKVTESVSCHQSLYPYLLYYCHSVPKVKVYNAEILDAKTKVKVNQGIATCHLDTSSWSPTHEAFTALGSSPGKTEVCHWIFENDMTWTIADN